ncbi:MAG: DUF3048 domain-containing protein [Candidatus Saccharibacteria bacterium]|nr:DUF3048 domain-containing protein [Candidatus Saccharibacteria bacterium]
MDDISWPKNKPKTKTRSKKILTVRGAPTVLDPLDLDIKSEEAVTELQTEMQPLENNADPLVIADASPAIAEPKTKRIFFKHTNMTKKKWAILIVVLIALIAAGVYGGMKLYKHYSASPKAKTSTTKTTKPVPPPITTGPSPLTGAEVDLSLVGRPVTGIMIENSFDARPQSGLKDAGIVYEAIAEGGITRFLALYQEARPDYIGPVRSVRPYYLDFLMPFNASIAHVGGAPQALAEIKTFGIHDLDQFANGNSYTRITQRFAPHNVYTSFDKMDALNAAKGFKYVEFAAFPRKKDSPTTPKPTTTTAATKPTVTTTTPIPAINAIDLAISGPDFNAHYDYDLATNTYKRSEGGAAHIDEKSAVQLAPKVVIALVMERGIASDGQHTDYSTTGNGHMFVFQDGTITEGTWTKSDRTTQFVFTNAAGQPLKLNAGQTWITLVDKATNVTYK